MNSISKNPSLSVPVLQEGDKVALKADYAHGFQTLKKGTKGHVVDVGISPLDQKTYIMVEFSKQQAVVGLQPIDVKKVNFPKT